MTIDSPTTNLSWLANHLDSAAPVTPTPRCERERPGDAGAVHNLEGHGTTPALTGTGRDGEDQDQRTEPEGSEPTRHAIPPDLGPRQGVRNERMLAG